MVLKGLNSRVKIGSNVVLDLNSATFAINGDIIDRTTFSSNGWKEYLSGLREADISISGFYNPADTTGQKALLTASTTGAVIQGLTYLPDKDVAASGFTCDALVENAELGSQVADLVSISFSLKSTGEIAVSA